MAVQPTSTTPLKPFGILFASGDPAGGKVICDGLLQEGFAVWAAPDGREALAQYGRHRDSIHVVLLDVRLPILDGPRTLAGLQKMNAKVRCYFMSSDIGSHSVRSLTSLGADGVLVKPFNLSYVTRMLIES